jgi:hypothetical protein
MPSGVFFTLDPKGDEYCVCQQRESDVAVPPTPSTHLILIQAALTLGRLEASFDFPPASGDIHQNLQ